MAQEGSASVTFKEYYAGMMRPAKMVGEMPEILRLAKRIHAAIGFTFNFNRKELWGFVLDFNDFTGRVTIAGGGSNQDTQWVRSVLIKKIQMFTFSRVLYEEWQRQNER